MTPDALVASALNITQHIKTYGGYAGFAAIIGLAVLAVLYFAQAREVKRLREWAGRGPERAAEVGARAADPGRRIVAEPAARPEPATAAAQSSPPPLAAAAVVGATGAAAAATAADAPAATAGDAGKPEGEAVLDGSPPSGTGDRVAAPGDTEDDIGATSVAIAPIPASARGRATATPAVPRRPRNGTPEPVVDQPSSRRRLWMILGGVAAVVIVVVLLVTLLGGGSAKRKPNTIASTPTPTAVTTGATKGGNANDAPPRGQIKVGVLNGTGTAGLAKATGQKLSGAGFVVPPEGETNASDQTHSATIVAYATGQKDAALEVARTLGLGRDALVPLDSDTKVVAQSALPSNENLTVVVTVGADLKP